MQPSLLDAGERERRGAGSSGVRPAIGAALVGGLVLLGLVFFREAVAAVEVWNASTAYSHCYLVLPMALYLLWERRDMLRRSVAQPSPRWALLALPLALVWLVAERLGIMEGRQLAAIAGAEVLILAILGRAVFTSISGPLLFLFFLVPFGAFVTPVLQQFTAAFTVVGLDMLSIPNYSDRFTIETPAGTFFVAEACAGLRFLIAAVAFGVFYALLTYTSRWRRLAFIALSVVVPIVANGFRALGIVVLGQVLGSAQAAAADHIVYGWLFFSVVMVLLILVGQLFRDRDPATAPPPVAPLAPARPSIAWAGAAASLLLLGIGPAVAAMIDARSTPATLAQAAPIAAPAGCAETPAEPSDQPSQRRAGLTCDGIRFDVWTELFPPRSTSSALVSRRRTITQEIGAEDASIAAAPARPGAGAWTVVQTTDPNRVTAFASWIDGVPSRSGLAGRLAQARDSLLGTDHAPALITITSAEPPASPPARRKATLERLQAIVQAQTGLDAAMARLTALDGAPRQ